MTDELSREQFIKTLEMACCQATTLQTIFSVKPTLEILWKHDAKQRERLLNLSDALYNLHTWLNGSYNISAVRQYIQSIILFIENSETNTNPHKD